MYYLSLVPESNILAPSQRQDHVYPTSASSDRDFNESAPEYSHHHSASATVSLAPYHPELEASIPSSSLRHLCGPPLRHRRSRSESLSTTYERRNTVPSVVTPAYRGRDRHRSAGSPSRSRSNSSSRLRYVCRRKSSLRRPRTNFLGSPMEEGFTAGSRRVRCAFISPPRFPP